MNLLSKQHSPFLYFIISVALLRVLLAPFVGLGVDEAHYVLYALNLDLSYFDHPPLVGWTQWIFLSLFGETELASRVSAILIGFITSIFIYKLIFDINKNEKEAFIALLALHASFLFNALFIMLLPDTLLFLLILPIIFTLIELEKKESLFLWLLLSIFLALSALAKYTAILFIPPIIIYLIFKKRYDLLFSIKALPALILGLMIISPIFIWNIQNDWISFTYQSEHVVGANTIQWKGFFRSLLAQFAAYNPFLAPVAFYGLYRAFKSQNNTLFLTSLFGLVLLFFFTYASLYKTALPHWSALFYMLFIPIGSFYFIENSKKYLKFSIGFGLFIALVAYGELGFKFIPQPNYQSLHRDIYGWDLVMQKVNEQIKEPQNQAIGVTNWTLASRALYYNREYNSSVYLIDDRSDQFDIWENKNVLGKNLIIIQTHFFQKNLKQYIKCDSLKKLTKFDITLNNNIVNTIELVECKNYKGLQ